MNNFTARPDTIEASIKTLYKTNRSYREQKRTHQMKECGITFDKLRRENLALIKRLVKLLKEEYNISYLK